MSPLRRFLAVNALLWMICGLVELLAWLLGYPERYFNPFYVGLRFYDFDSFQERFHALHTAAFWDLTTLWPFAYPAPCAVVYRFFFQFGIPASLNVFLAFSAAGFLLVFALFGLALVHRGVPPRQAALFTIAGYLLAFPFWFLFQRGNLEIVVFLALAAGVAAFLRGHGYAAAACFALAASFKIVPLLYFALFLGRRQYRELLLAVGVTAGLTVGSLWFVGPTIPQAWHGISAGVALFTREFLFHPKPDSTGFDHALFSLVRRFVHDPPLTARLYRLYTPVIALLGATLYVARIRVLPLLNQLLCLTLAAIWLSPVSFEYTLVHLYLSVGVLLLAGLDGSLAGRPARVILFQLAVLVSPLSELILHGERIAGQVQSVLLLTLFVQVLRWPLPTSFDEQRPGR